MSKTKGRAHKALPIPEYITLDAEGIEDGRSLFSPLLYRQSISAD
jgi:hypothetical protein